MLNWVLEFIFAMSLFFNAFLFIPQGLSIYQNKTSKEISLFTFFGFNIMQVFTAYRGYLQKDYLLMAGFLLSFVTCGVVTVLIIYYRINKKNGTNK
jgi:MtN3 and saliva related transmembrane protein